MTANAYDLTTIVPGLEYKAEFVPLSASRNAGEKNLSLNWKVTFKRGRATLTTDYMQWIGHLPGYKQGRQTIDKDNDERRAAETGKWPGYGRFGSHGADLKPPTAADVMHSLLSDAEAIDSPTFEEWAAEQGYDTDSRSAEAIYKACVEIGLKLRLLLGEENMRAMRDYLADL